MVDQVIGVWQRGDGLEFIRYELGRPGELEVLARTEQGFWLEAAATRPAATFRRAGRPR